MNPVVLRIVGPTILVVAALIAVVVGLVIGGGAAPRLTSDPGAIVRWGLPAAKLFVNLAGASMLGPLVLAVFALPSAGKPFTVALDVASAGAATLTITSGVVAFLTFLSSFNPQVNLSAEFGAQLGRFLLDTELGRSWLITAILASVVTVLAFAVRSYGAVLITTVLAVISLIPMATQGHSGELANHDPAVMSLVLHVIAAAIWLGGLILLVVVRPISSPHELDNMLRRYSTVALIAFIGVAVSGYARALTALGRWEGVASPYGLILLTKIGALLVMGVLGATYRRRLLAKASEGRGAFWMIVCVELGFMGIASGAAAALARTAAPADTIALPQNTAAEILTDAPVPIELTLQRWFTAWSPDLLWVLVAGFGIVFYLVGVRRAQRRGYPWPARRTISWIVGMGCFCGRPVDRSPPTTTRSSVCDSSPSLSSASRSPCSLSSRRPSPSQPWSSIHGTMEAEDRGNGFSGPPTARWHGLLCAPSSPRLFSPRRCGYSTIPTCSDGRSTTSSARNG